MKISRASLLTGTHHTWRARASGSDRGDDIYLNGHPRENWGMAERPKHPEAMDEITPTLKADMKIRTK